MRFSFFLCSLFLFASPLLAQGYKTARGFVPDSATAVKIAEAVLVPVYGESKVTAERPFHAALKDDVWVVEGALHCPGARDNSAGCSGGVATVQYRRPMGVFYLCFTENSGSGLWSF